MSKIKVLVVPSDRSGVSKFRSVDPHLKLQELYGDDFFVDIVTAGTDNFDWDNDNFIKGFDVVHFHRALPMIKNQRLEPAYDDDAKKIFDKFKKHGVKLVMDLDDYWMVTQDHPAYNSIKNSGMDKQIINNIKMVDYVTTTTPIYAKTISKINKNVIVLPNSVDPSEEQFQPKSEKTDKKLRVGWLGGSSHLADLQLASSSVSQFLSKHKEDTQFVLCGFDLRGQIQEQDPNTGQIRTRKLRPEESVWSNYEKLFTSNYNLINSDYKKELLSYDDMTNGKEENYRRVWTKPITTYASNYNLFDVSLAPVKEHIFNQMKSQLKVIEAGFHKKALIASNFGPYQLDLVNAYERGGSINPDGNAFLVDKHRNHKEWGKYLEILYKNPDLVTQLGENLYQSVQKYHIDNVTKSRAEFYKSIVNDKENEVKQLIEEVNAI
jgi:glycosyltransferase involved in cell wall biosynthesis